MLQLWLGWIINDPGAIEIIPIGLNFRPASEGAKRGLRRILVNGLKEIRIYLGTT
jgi:hypothetical protein